MGDSTLVVIGGCLFLYGLVQRRLQLSGLTGALVFTAVGMVVGTRGLEVGGLALGTSALAHLVELTLTLVLFADASRIDLRALRREAALPGRLLGVGLPLTMLAGVVLARVLFTDLDLGLVLLLGIMLAPTDASLGQAVVTDPRVPMRVRQGLNVESGLNDGICMPFFTVAVALAVEEEGGGSGLVVEAVRELGGGLVVGLAVGALAALALREARRRSWTDLPGSQLTVITVPLLAYGAAVLVEGSGFIAAFVAGLAFGTLARDVGGDAYELTEDVGQLLTALTFLVFGGLALDQLRGGGALPFVYAVLSLTVVRMLPVAVSLLGSGTRRPTVAFVGWFGPRGLASVLLLVLTLEAAGGAPGVQAVAAAVTWTVLLSILLHGLSAPPLTARYAAWFASVPRPADLPESVPVQPHRFPLRRFDPTARGSLTAAVGEEHDPG